MNNDPKLPRSVQEVADVIGRDQALTLVDSLPRAYSRPWQICVYVPKTVGPDHALSVILGWGVAQTLARAFGGELLKLAGGARAARGEAVRAALRSGQTVQDVAREYRMSDRQVRNIVKEITQVANSNTPADIAAA